MACPNTLDDLERQCDITLGFESVAYIAREDEVSTIGAATDGVVSTITMVATKKFYTLPVSTVPGKNKIESDTQGDDDASYLENKSELVIPGGSGAASAVLGDTRKNRYIVILVDKDGKKWILGAKNDGAAIKPKWVHDGSVKQYTLAITATSKFFPFEFSGTIQVS